jgi:uncharacterized protein YbjT (DUF2867 family)
MQDTVLVLGAAGLVGGAVVAQLERLGVSVRAATRNPELRELQARVGSEWVEFDFERPDTFLSALDGVSSMFLLARPGDERSDEVARPLIDCARRAGVRRVVNLTALGVERAEHASALRHIELYLEKTGLEYTHLRPNWFMQTFTRNPLLSGILKAGVIAVPAAEGRISYIDGRDVAAVAVAALTRPGHGGKAYDLTGQEALKHSEIAAVISAAAQRTVDYAPLDEDAARRLLSPSGLSDERIDRVLGFYRLVRAGLASPVSSAVQEILGRPATTFAEFAHEHAGVWGAAVLP